MIVLACDSCSRSDIPNVGDVHEVRVFDNLIPIKSIKIELVWDEKKVHMCPSCLSKMLFDVLGNAGEGVWSTKATLT